ncbi:hypothetical protein [Haladaptatus sp. ZSTT2]|uniref:hypothetical protein n=1 Tax=Haladaptatus sp. ZSTT2 TaxID=3120515 RepID=UPI00300ED9DA
MAMGTELLIASTLAGLNIILLAALTFVWARNYRTFRTNTILGLIAFGAVMLVENAVALYFFFTMQMFYGSDPTVQGAVAVLRALQFVALVFLTWVTVK